jgi:hypothetical protein
MKKILIQGHSTRGKEVIKALEDLGGINFFNYEGTSKELYYYIDNGNNICVFTNKLLDEKDNLCTLEEYLNIKNNMEERTIKISLETAKEWYKGDNEALKNIALQAFTETELQGIAYVKSWNEFCEKYNNKNNDYFIGTYSNPIPSDIGGRDIKKDRNLLATKEDAEAFLALMQLKRLRDQWWESLNWKPDYTNDIYKYIIVVDKNEISIGAVVTYHRFLVFPTKEIAEEFLKCFKDLINKAKELI